MDINTLTHSVVGPCSDAFNVCSGFFTSPDVPVLAKVLTPVFALWGVDEAVGLVKNEIVIWKERKARKSNVSGLDTDIN